MEQDELIERDLTLMVHLPGGQERPVTVHGSKPVMDLLVALCAQYHLNPSDHTFELHSTNQNQIKFKPNSLIGCLEAEQVVLKPKGSDDGCRKAPNMPVATVRLMINYKVSHKAVVRVDPRAPLVNLLPAICDKCEFDPSTTVLLRNRWSEDPLDLTKTLNDYGIRDLYAKDTKVTSSSPKLPTTHTHKDCKDEELDIREKGQRGKENRGILGLFRKSKKATEEGLSNSNSTPTSPVLNNQNMVNISCLKTNCPTATMPTDMPKKRRAPQPPSMAASQSFPCGLNSSQTASLPTGTSNGSQVYVSSTESSLKRTKRRAPPPPCISPTLPDSSDKGASFNLPSVEETQEETEIPSYLSESSSDQYGDSTTACWPYSSPSLMLEILSEFEDKMKTRTEGELSSDSSVTYLPPAASPSSNIQSVPDSPESTEDSSFSVSLINGMLRHIPQREGLTTFTVVPQRRPSTQKQYEVCITLETTGALVGVAKTEKLEPLHKPDAELDVDWRNDELDGLNSKEPENPEMSKKQTLTVEKKVGENGNPEGLRGELLRMVEHAFDNHQHNVEAENLLAEETEKTEGPLSEDEDSDWIAVYRERRRRFQAGDGIGNARKLDQWMKKLSYNILEDVGENTEEGFPQPPPSSPSTPVYWEGEERERENHEEGEIKKENGRGIKENDKELNAFSIRPKLFAQDHQHEADIASYSDLHWDETPCSNQNSTYSYLDVDEPHISKSHLPPDNFQSKLDPNGRSGSEPSSPNVSCQPEKASPSTPPSPGTVSLFALAVSRRVESLQRNVYTLTPPAEKGCFQTKPSVGCDQFCPIEHPTFKSSPSRCHSLKPYHLKGSCMNLYPTKCSPLKSHHPEGTVIESQPTNGSILKPCTFKCPTPSFYPINL